jgi:hypothetical protein
LARGILFAANHSECGCLEPWSPGDWEMLDGGVAGKITKIAHEKGKRHEADIEVIFLKELIKASFDVDFLNPPPPRKRK